MCARCPCYSLSPRNVLRDICLDRTKRRQAGVGRWSDFHLTYVRLWWQVSFWNFRYSARQLPQLLSRSLRKSPDGKQKVWRAVKTGASPTTTRPRRRWMHVATTLTTTLLPLPVGCTRAGLRDLQSWGSARVGSCGLFHRGRFYSGWIAFCSLVPRVQCRVTKGSVISSCTSEDCCCSMRYSTASTTSPVWNVRHWKHTLFDLSKT